MKIAIIGATGHLGGAAAREAQERGHRVTSLSRPAVDILDAESVARAVARHDAVVVAVKGDDHVVPRGAEILIEALGAADVRRLIFVGGGGSLEQPPGQRIVDAPEFPPQYLATALDQAAALEIFRKSGDAIDWSYASPPPVHLVDGAKTGQYRVQARDTPIVDEAGESRITVGDFASAIIDVVENGRFIRERFTAAH
jgi:putative NADH-flavin reductase